MQAPATDAPNASTTAPVIVSVRAGGVGTRLWPLSRGQAPKQLHALVGEKTMLDMTLDRARRLVPESQIVITVNHELEDALRAVLPETLQRNLIVEPTRRDTAPALGLEATIIEARWPGATIIGMPADSLIVNEDQFEICLRTMMWGIERHPEALFCIGAKPTFAHTGLGYIKIDGLMEEHDDVKIFRIDQFVEKPPLEHARQYIKSFEYLWNANYFSWKASTVLDLYRQFMPATADKLAQIAAAVGTDQESSVLADIYPTFEKEAFDYAIMEKAPQRMVIPADVGWSDIGDWSALRDVVLAEEARESENHVQGRHVSIDTTGTLIRVPEGKIVATIGVKDLVIVDTGDALLVCPSSRAQEVKKIVEQLTTHGWAEVL